MATSKKLLSEKNNKKSSKVQAVVASPWSTANYANFSFGSPTGVSSLTENYEDEKKDELAEEDDETKKDEVAEEDDETKKDEVAEDEKTPEDEKKDELAERHDEKTPEDEKKDELAEDEETPEDEKKIEVDEDEDEHTSDAESKDSDDDTLDIDIAELLDSEEDDVVELTPADTDEVEPEFTVAEADDDSAPINVDIEDEDESVKENEETPEDEKKDELAEDEETPEDEKKDELAEDEETPEDEKKDELAEDEETPEDEKKEVSEGKLRLSFKTAEATKLFKNNIVLTEEDKRQSRVLFESAIRSVAKQLGAQLREAYQVQFEKAKSQHEAKVAKQIDSYMSYVVERWSKDNKVALQNQMRNRLTESFLAGFKKLCVEHYIEIPESKVNVVEALAKNVKNLKTKLQHAEAQNVKFHEESRVAIVRERAALKKEHKSRLIAEAAGAVTAADRGEFVQRAQTVTFASTKEFKKDLIALREQYFAAKKTVSLERPSTEPVAMPIFEAKTETPKSSIDAYTKVADRLTRQ